jgi:hypothetical protein
MTESSEPDQADMCKSWAAESMASKAAKLDELNFKIMELYGVVQALDLINVQMDDSKGKRFACDTLTKVILERCTEIEETLGQM